MSSHSSLDALASERQHSAQLRKSMLVLAVMSVAGMYFAWSKPKQIDLHVSPALQAGETISVQHGVAPVAPPNVYSFAYYVWQQINRWQADGGKDYGTQIYTFQSFLTPRCRAQLEGDLAARANATELRQRTRHITEVPGFGFQEQRVIADGNSAWTVLLDMQVMETFRGQPVKDTFIRYPVRVVRYDVDRQRNPYQLAVDCFGSNKPARLDISAPQTKSLDNVGPIVPDALPKLAPRVAAPLPAPASASAQ